MGAALLALVVLATATASAQPDASSEQQQFDASDVTTVHIVASCHLDAGYKYPYVAEVASEWIETWIPYSIALSQELREAGAVPSRLATPPRRPAELGGVRGRGAGAAPLDDEPLVRLAAAELPRGRRRGIVDRAQRLDPRARHRELPAALPERDGPRRVQGGGGARRHQLLRLGVLHHVRVQRRLAAQLGLELHTQRRHDGRPASPLDRGLAAGRAWGHPRGRAAARRRRGDGAVDGGGLGQPDCGRAPGVRLARRSHGHGAAGRLGKCSSPAPRVFSPHHEDDLIKEAAQHNNGYGGGHSGRAGKMGDYPPQDPGQGDDPKDSGPGVCQSAPPAGVPCNSTITVPGFSHALALFIQDDNQGKHSRTVAFKFLPCL